MLEKTFQWTNLDWAQCFILLVTGGPGIIEDMGDTPQIWETLMRTYRKMCGVSGFLQKDLGWHITQKLLASSIVCHYSAHPTHLELICVHTNVAQIWVVKRWRANPDPVNCVYSSTLSTQIISISNPHRGYSENERKKKQSCLFSLEPNAFV